MASYNCITFNAGSTTEHTRNEIVLSVTVMSASLAILMSLIIVAFIVGCVCGYFLSQRFRSKNQLNNDVASYQMVLNSQILQEQSLTMKENVAYGPLQITN